MDSTGSCGRTRTCDTVGGDNTGSDDAVCGCGTDSSRSYSDCDSIGSSHTDCDCYASGSDNSDNSDDSDGDSVGSSDSDSGSSDGGSGGSSDSDSDSDSVSGSDIVRVGCVGSIDSVGRSDDDRDDSGADYESRYTRMHIPRWLRERFGPPGWRALSWLERQRELVALHRRRVEAGIPTTDVLVVEPLPPTDHPRYDFLRRTRPHVRVSRW